MCIDLISRYWQLSYSYNDEIYYPAKIVDWQNWITIRYFTRAITIYNKMFLSDDKLILTDVILHKM